jgi:DNA repair protein RadC
MSLYDELSVRLTEVSRIRFLYTSVPVFLAIAMLAYIFPWAHSSGSGVGVICMSILLGPALLRSLLEIFSQRYRRFSRTYSELKATTRGLSEQVQKIYDAHPPRRKGKQFKTAYALNGRDLADFERAMAIGMKFEAKEVFVTAFLRQGKVVRVTASIGSPFRCSAADNPRLWSGHYLRLGCDEIRQYHNHPDYRNHSEPSRQDRRSNAQLQGILEPSDIKLQSFVVYWNEIGEWRTLRYDSNQLTKLEFAYDASV